MWACGPHGFIIKCFLLRRFIPGNIKLPSKRSSGLFVCKILMESDCTAQMGNTCATDGKFRDEILEILSHSVNSRTKSTNFLKVGLLTDELVSKDAVS